MRWIYLVTVIFVSCNSKPTGQEIQEDVLAYPFIISSDTNHLFYGIWPDLKPDTSVDGLDFPDKIRFHSDIEIQYETEMNVDKMLYESGQIIYHFKSEKIFKKSLKNIDKHLMKFAVQHSRSDTFYTYILPYISKPLIEINLFINREMKSIVLNFTFRDHV